MSELIAFFKTYQLTVKIIDQFLEAWLAYDLIKIRTNYAAKDTRRRFLLKNLERAQTDVEKAEIAKWLFELNHN